MLKTPSSGCAFLALGCWLSFQAVSTLASPPVDHMSGPAALPLAGDGVVRVNRDMAQSSQTSRSVRTEHVLGASERVAMREYLRGTQTQVLAELQGLLRVQMQNPGLYLPASGQQPVKSPATTPVVPAPQPDETQSSEISESLPPMPAVTDVPPQVASTQSILESRDAADGVGLWATSIGDAMALQKLAVIREQELRSVELALAAANDVWATETVVTRAVFDSPAHFPNHTVPGDGAFSSGLVLLEGMQLDVLGDGKWQLMMPHIPSASPAELHLQLRIKTRSGGWATLTLKPICIEAAAPCEPGCNGSDTVPSASITLAGSSPMLAEAGGVVDDVRRTGRVVYGHGLEGLVGHRAR